MAFDHSREEREARLLPDAPHLFDLPGAAAGLRGEPVYSGSGRSGTTLVKHSELRVVLQALRQGAGLAEHHAPGPITVQVLEGELEFTVGDSVHALRPGSLLVLPAGVPHAVHAVQDAVFLLTIVPLAAPAA